MSITRTTFLTLTLVAAVSGARAADSPPNEQHPGMDAKAMEMMKPGPEHQRLAKLAGTWDVAATMWMKPDAPAMKSQGVETIKPVFDGRFLHAEYQGSFMGQPFTGYSTMGFDRAANKYFSTWHDSMATGFLYLTGTSSDGGKTITYHGDMMCPANDTTEKVTVRQVETHESDDRFTLVMYNNKGGTEHKNMELVYTRRQ